MHARKAQREVLIVQKTTKHKGMALVMFSVPDRVFFQFPEGHSRLE